QLDPLRDRDADERRDRDVAPPVPEERALEVGVRAVERLVVPVEPAAALRGRDQEAEEDGSEERLVLTRTCARVRAREDRRGRLSAELLERQPGVLAGGKLVLAWLDERANEWLELVQRRPAALDVLFEGERELGALLELTPEQDERPEREPAEERIEMGCAHGHASGY